ncbi:phosphocholine-specific phospholipase C [Myroides sp. LJL116]
MKPSRRDFIKVSSLFTTGLCFNNGMPSSIQRALSIDPIENSDFTQAEHIVFLMQENRSFDHAFGCLQGVRGFNDPRAMLQPDGLPVYLQSDPLNHKIYGPFHLDLVNTKITWMGSLPHSWKDMVEARNNGDMNNWLNAKRPYGEALKYAPLTMGYFERQDIPFYYALADAFTVCDQHFCSSLTGTSANRSFFWSGTVREKPHDPESTAHLDNGQINYKNVGWSTYPERLEKAGISWKVYQNELSIPVGLTNDQENWLANFTDNNLEFHQQYNVRLHKAHTEYLVFEKQRVDAALEKEDLTPEQKSDLIKKQERLEKDMARYNQEAFDRLSDFEKAIHKKAFTTNEQDPNYHELEQMHYHSQGQEKQTSLPKGDVFYQFRKDVDSGQLPMVSWLVAPCNFSDHPGAPWFGAWYLSEAIDILTKDPKVFQKTIFILTYDENDGYFDHVAPFVPALQGDLSTGKMSPDLYSPQEWVTKEQERKRSGKPDRDFQSPIGFGFRVPMVVVSPWTKGGWVNSEVMDLTSTIQFLEYFIEKKTGKKIIEQNISPYRRAVSGNMTSVFQPASSTTKVELDFVERQQIVQTIMQAKDKKVPDLFQEYTLEQIKSSPTYRDLPGFAKQEKGVKKACALPYNMIADLHCKESQLELDFSSQPLLNSNKTYGAPLQVYSIGSYAHKQGANWDFTVLKDQSLDYTWKVDQFEGENTHLVMHGANGFYRSFKQSKTPVGIQVKVNYTLNKGLIVHLQNQSTSSLSIELQDKVYLKKSQEITLGAKQSQEITLDYQNFKGWYQLELRLKGHPAFEYIYAGHIEDNSPSITDPYMASLSN